MSRVPVYARGDTTSLADRKRRAGQRLILSLEGVAPSADLRAVAAEVRPAGFLLRPDNLIEAGQVWELCRELSSLVGNERPAILALDLGTASSWAWSTPWPTAGQLGEIAELDFTRDVAAGLGRELAALGVHLMLGPTADLGADERSHSDGGVFGGNPEQVATQVHAFVTGLQAAGVGAAVRGFPGCRGATRVADRLVVDRGPGDLEEWDLRAFVQVVRRYPPRPVPVAPPMLPRGRPPLLPVTREGVAAAVLLPQVLFPAFDECRTAACSPAVIAGLLREGTDFCGLALSDLPGAWSVASLEAAAAVAAGADLVLVPGPVEVQDVAWEAVVKGQEEDPTLERRMEHGDLRLLAFRVDFLRPWGEGATPRFRPRPPLACIGSEAHLRLARGERLARRRP
jgi:beta-N-acetylhexosaminidase